MGTAVKIFFVVLAAIYPIAVFFGMQYFEPKYLALLLAAIALRNVINSDGEKTLLNRRTNIVLTFIVLLIVGYTWIDNSLNGLKLYPVLVNFFLLIVFLTSVFYPPTIIERLARLQEPELSTSGVIYTKNVTKIWCVFFVLNGAVALYTALYSTIEVWTLYNGLLAYILMGCLLLGEVIYRRLVLRK